MSLDIEAWGRRPGEPSVAWREPELQVLRLAVNNGDSDDAIAAKLGRTPRAVAVKRSKLGLTVRSLGRGRGIKAVSDETLIRELRRRGYRVESQTHRVCGVRESEASDG